MKPIHWRIAAYIAAGAFLLYWFAQWQQRQGTESGAIIQSAQQALAMGHSYRTRQTLLAKRAEQALAASRRGELAVKSLRDSLLHAPTPRDTIRLQIILVDSLTAQRDSLSLAEAFQRVRAERAEARVTLLEQNLQATLTVADCRLMGVKWFPRCPSRNLSLVLGLGTGAIAVLALHH